MSRWAGTRGKVLFLAPVTTKHLVFGLGKWFPVRLYMARPELWVHRPLILPGDGKIPGVSKLNRALLIRSTRKCMRRCGINKPVLWSSNVMHWIPENVIGESMRVFDLMDDYSGYSWAPVDVNERERAQIFNADLVFTGSGSLARRWEKTRSKAVHFIQNGVDAAHFIRAEHEEFPEPEDISGLPGSRVGYIGVISNRIDHRIIEHIARNQPDLGVVMVGPVLKDFPPMEELANVRFVGQKAYEELPAYLKYISVCLLPMVENAFTRNMNPTKLLEYLAAGKPVVSTPIPEVVGRFLKWVEIAQQPGEFLEAIRRCLLEDSPEKREKRIRFAQTFSWEKTLAEMEKHLRAAYNRKYNVI
ncbi:MAG: glycosyltransferase [Deltaproteobacteria bacterium]|nr:glycosyltransferase [Deltaproteobacteria bacterium]